MPNTSRITSTWRRMRRALLASLPALALALSLSAPAQAQQEDPPGRVGRIAELQGGVSWFDSEQGRWSEAERNRPVTGGDRLSTQPGGRAEIRVGSTVLRLGASTELEFLRLDEERLVLQLHAGALALRVRSREAADETEVRTAELRLLPQRAGHYRFDRVDDTTWAGAWRGDLLIDGQGGATIAAGQRLSFIRDRGDILRSANATLPDDAFATWVARDDQQDERSAANRYVSPEMTGAEDLDRYGRWTTHPEYGALWYPLEVRADWAPYRHGRWAWVRPWGWTWIDEAPWGFAPFHYGRWVSWQGRWGWVPGAYVARPIYAPALVAWVGTGGVSVGVQIGGPGVGHPGGWIPLAPREVFRPYYRATPVYQERINPAPPYRWQHAPLHQPGGPMRYANPAVQRAVEAEPRQTWRQRPPGMQPLQEQRAVEGGGPPRQRREAGAPQQQGAQPAQVQQPVQQQRPPQGQPPQRPAVENPREGPREGSRERPPERARERDDDRQRRPEGRQNGREREREAQR
jgi:hypothetical protein